MFEVVSGVKTPTSPRDQSRFEDDSPGAALRGMTSSLDSSLRLVGNSRQVQEMNNAVIIASGCFGEVSRAVLDLDHKEYVVKRMVRKVASERDLQNRLQEIFALAACKCTGVVRIYDAWVAGGNVFIRTEYLTGGSIRSIPKPWGEEMLWTLIEAVGGALHWLHSNRIIHLDVKPDNIFFATPGTNSGRRGSRGLASMPMDGEIVFKLGDFGLARPLEDAATQTGEKFTGKNDDEGDKRYLSPEVMESLFGNESSQFGKAADVYALGATIIDLIGGDPEQVRLGTLPVASLRKYSPTFQNLIQQMTCLDPAHRLDIFTVMLHCRNRCVPGADPAVSSDLMVQTRERLDTIDRLTAELEYLERQ